ncbi:MAG TPA: nucleotidyltransferase domain-containing protein [Phycisphaerae bacterium]|nr:nucleotidyltransferase domain-containing protein [Phycisphaerae bacterium]
MTFLATGIRVELPLEAIEALCQKHGVAELSVFGSVLRDDFREDSDIDFLVRFKDDDSGPWGAKYDDLAADLSALLGRGVDVVAKSSIERSENYLRREHILRNARVIYVA